MSSSAIRNLHSKTASHESLRAFARRLLDSGTPDQQAMVETWLDNKAGAITKQEKAARKAKKGALIAEQKRACKAARTKKKS
jgi:hypothetical protein